MQNNFSNNIFFQAVFEKTHNGLLFWLAVMGFVSGWFFKGWASGVIYALIAPLLLIPFLLILTALGCIFALFTGKH